MLDDYDPPFDFEVKAGRASGLRIEVSPGNDRPYENEFINIDERPFRLVEFYICKRIATPELFSHYGENIIEIGLWIAAVTDSLAYLNTNCEPSSASATWKDRGYYELANELRENSDTSLLGLKSLAQELHQRAIRWSQSHSFVFIFGI